MTFLKFAHLADCHIGSWREPKLRDSSTKAFVKAVELCIDKEVDFILISGDLFNTSIPSIDCLKETVNKLKKLQDKKIPVYVVAGSHDFSPSGKTMLDVLENAGLMINVAKGDIIDNHLKLNFTIDKKTNAKITGLLGKRGGLEKSYYENLMKEHLENEQGYKIFMFHSALTEFKPEELKDMESNPLSLLPKNFNYYAGGHVHYRFNKKEDEYGLICFPGPLFPNNFKELEDLERGSICIVTVNKSAEDISQQEESRYITTIEQEPIQIHNIFKINIDANNKTPLDIEQEIETKISGKEFNNTIVTIRIKGTLLSGKQTDINFKEIFTKLYNKSAYFVMKNTSKLITKEFEEIKIDTGSVDDIEDKLIKEHLGQIKVTNLNPEKEENLIKNLMIALSKDKLEGEKVIDFETRVKQEVDKILEI